MMRCEDLPCLLIRVKYSFVSVTKISIALDNPLAAAQRGLVGRIGLSQRDKSRNIPPARPGLVSANRLGSCRRFGHRGVKELLFYCFVLGGKLLDFGQPILRLTPRGQSPTSDRQQ